MGMVAHMRELGAMVRGRAWVHSALVMVMSFVDHGGMILCMERQVVLLMLVATFVFSVGLQFWSHTGIHNNEFCC